MFKDRRERKVSINDHGSYNDTSIKFADEMFHPIVLFFDDVYDSIQAIIRNNPQIKI